MTQDSAANSLKQLQQQLPMRLSSWSAEPQDRLYDEKTIFGYINGGAEVYKAYNMRACLSRRYASTDGPTIVLDIFDMGSPADAFGVFTHDMDGKVIDVGQNARLQPGWLSFWKYRFFVSIYAEDDTEVTEKAVRELAEKVAAGIPQQGVRPKILSRLPRDGLLSQSIRYLHHPIVLNYHYYVADENILNITAKTDAALAGYRVENQDALLLLVVYPHSEQAENSRVSFLKHYLPDADRTGVVLLENGKWAAIKKKERLLAIVLEAESRKLAERLLKHIQ